MNKTTWLAVSLLGALISADIHLHLRDVPEPEILATSTVKQVDERPKLNHQQEVWLHTLEWCESRGKASAINPEDRDGTPSYGAYQFKPSTLFYFSQKYGLELDGDAMVDWRFDTVATNSPIMDYKFQRSVVEQMVLHSDEIDWNQQFPDCVKKFGRPPKA